MAQLVREVMTPDPVSLTPHTPAIDAAREMRDRDTGAILVVDGDSLTGIVTDRDIVVRAVAEGMDPEDCRVGDICTSDPDSLSPDQPVEEAIRILRQSKVRRVPVVEDGQPVGIVSIGDLAIERDTDSALADISSAPANN
jgi:signal-transduction protein with cAMP-binding, CBS, and nucleotidyltransferase domain